MSMNIVDFPVSDRTRRVRAGQPIPAAEFSPISGSMAVVIDTACDMARLDGARDGYLDGARAGRIAGFVWGLMLGAGIATAVAAVAVA